MDAAKEIVDRTRAFLKACRVDTQNLLADAKASQWETISFESYAVKIKNFDLPVNKLKTAKDNYRKRAKQFLAEIDGWENEIGHLDTDIQYKSIPPETAEKTAGDIERRSVKTLEAQVSELKLYSGLFAEADKALRDKITLHVMVQFAKSMKEAKPLAIEEGYGLFKTFSGDTTDTGQETSLFDFFAHATRLESAMNDIDLSGLGGLAAAVVDHQIKTALRLLAQIKNFINYFEQKIQGELESIEKYQEELQAFAKKELKYIFDNTDATAEKAGQKMIDLSRKARTMGQFEFIPTMLAELKLFHHSVKNIFLEALQKQIDVAGSPINPATLAAEKTVDFFYGLQGLIRSVKLFFSTMGGKQVISREDLQVTLTDAMNNCVIFYSNKPSDLDKLKAFIDNYISSFSKPFPYEELLQLLKETLYTYGKRLEKHITNFELKTQSETEQEGQQAAAPASIKLGRLVRKFEMYTEKLDTA